MPDSGRTSDDPGVTEAGNQAEKQTVPVKTPNEHGRRWTTRRVLWWALVLGCLYFAATVVDVWWTGTRPTDSSAPAAVVLGAAQYNGEPSAVLKARLDRAAELWLDERVDVVVVTGGGQEADITTEAKTGYDYLRQTAGLDDSDLRLEVQGSSTYESLAAVSRFLAREGITEVIVVTDSYHAKRSQMIAEEVGMKASVYPTEAAPPLDRLLQESAAVAVGRIISFRRLDSYVTR